MSGDASRLRKCVYCSRAAMGWPCRRCYACYAPFSLQPTNVNIAEDHVAALESSYEVACKDAHDRGVGALLKQLEEIAGRTCLTIDMPALDFVMLLNNQRNTHKPYAWKVPSGRPLLKDYEGDARRRSVESTMYGTDGGDIIYGALGFGGRGLMSYGDVHVTLHESTFEHRVSVIRENSFDMVELAAGQFPLGSISTWGNRGKLAVVKLSGKIRPTMTYNDLHRLVLHSDGVHHNDVFLEAHVYGGFNIDAVQTVHLHELPKDLPPPQPDEIRVLARKMLEELRDDVARRGIQWL